jgi:hypothetical protein
LWLEYLHKFLQKSMHALPFMKPSSVANHTRTYSSCLNCFTLAQEVASRACGLTDLHQIPLSGDQQVRH